VKKPVQYVLIAAVALLAVISIVLLVQNRRTSAAYKDVKIAEETSRSHYAEAFNAIVEIQDSLKAIALGDTTVRVLSDELQAEQKPTDLRRRQALARIANLDASVRRTKERVRQLESNLKASGIKIVGLQRMITDVKTQLNEKEMMVGQLTTRVDSLQTRVTGLETEVAQSQETIQARERTIEEKRRELGTIYYVVGSKDELVKGGVVAPRGGLLGMGRTLQVTGNYDESLFTALDTDQESVVRTHATKAQVLSQQPPSSYEMKLEGGWMELHILDPQTFRTVKHLVILTR